MMNRRSFMGALLAVGAAPAIAKASSLMPLWVPRQEFTTAWGYELLDLSGRPLRVTDFSAVEEFFVIDHDLASSEGECSRIIQCSPHSHAPLYVVQQTPGVAGRETADELRRLLSSVGVGFKVVLDGGAVV